MHTHTQYQSLSYAPNFKLGSHSVSPLAQVFPSHHIPYADNFREHLFFNPLEIPLDLSPAIFPAELTGMFQAPKDKEDVFSFDLVHVLIVFC